MKCKETTLREVDPSAVPTLSQYLAYGIDVVSFKMGRRQHRVYSKRVGRALSTARVSVSAYRRITDPYEGRTAPENGKKEIREGSATGKIQSLVYSKPFKPFATFSDLCGLCVNHVLCASTPTRRIAPLTGIFGFVDRLPLNSIRYLG